MKPTVLIVAAAIGWSNPALSQKTREAYAAAVIDAATHADVSPFMIAALIHHESHWHSGRVGGLGGQCIGFGQVCLHIYPECKTFKEPICLEKKLRLLDPFTNIRVIGQFMRAWRLTCPKLTGKKPGEAGILSGYGGYDLAAGTRCGLKKTKKGWVTSTSKGVRDILAIKKTLMTFGKRKK